MNRSRRCSGVRSRHQLLDTSASYGSGHNHELINKALKGRRERIVIHSKSAVRAPRMRKVTAAAARRISDAKLRAERQAFGIDALDVFCMSRVDPDFGRRVGGRDGAVGGAD